MVLKRSGGRKNRLTHPYSSLGDTITFDGEPEVGINTCQACEETHPTAQGFLNRNGAVFAAYIASWNPHGGESWVDMTIGSFDDPGYDDHVLFSCRIGPIETYENDVCTLVTPTWGGEFPPPILGLSLNRDAALAHPWLPDFWDAVDWLMFNDPFFHQIG